MPARNGASSSIQNAGLIRNRRGHVTVLETEALEEVSCECYRRITEQEDTLLS